MADFAVDAHDLVKVFPKGNVRALDGVSLQVATGTVLGLLGPNGAGKTTAVRILSTILAPDSGRATILGHDVVKEAADVRRMIGLAGQYATVDENLTGRENLRMVGRLTHMGRRTIPGRGRRVAGAVRAVGCSEPHAQDLLGWHAPQARPGSRARWRGHRCCSSTSRPRVSIPRAGRTCGRSSRGSSAAGTTVQLTTQYLEEADRLCQRVVVIDHGKVIAEGTPAELKADLGTTVISVILPDAEAAHRAQGLLQTVAGKAPALDGSTIELTVEDGPRVAAEVLRILDQQDVPVAGLSLREPSLDDVFLSLTGHRAEPAADGADGEDNADGLSDDGRRTLAGAAGERKGSR